MPFPSFPKSMAILLILFAPALLPNQPAHALQAERVELGEGGAYDGTVLLERNASDRLTLTDSEVTSPVTLGQLLYNSQTHGELLGLGQDDHPQYLRADGARPANSFTVTGDLTTSGGVNLANGILTINPNNGHTGIGTSSPSAQLDVSSSGNTESRISSTAVNGRPFVSFADGSARRGFVQWHTAGLKVVNEYGGISLQTGSGGSPSEAVYLNPSGNMGIGTGSPDEKVTIQSTSEPTIEVDTDGTADKAALKLQSSDHYGATLLYDDAPSRRGLLLGLRNNTTLPREDVFIARCTGHVGIGTSSPDARLDVAGQINANSFQIENTEVITSNCDATFEELTVKGLPRLTPNDQTVTTGTATLGCSAGLLRVTCHNSLANYTMTSTPTVETPTLLNGEVPLLTLCNVSTPTLTLQDESTLSGSGLQLQAATTELEQFESIRLMYTGGEWIETPGY